MSNSSREQRAHRQDVEETQQALPGKALLAFKKAVEEDPEMRKLILLITSKPLKET